MQSFDWFGLVFGLVGIVFVCSSAYEWTWWWRLARGVYLPGFIGWERTRLVYLAAGFGAFGVGSALVIKSVFSMVSFDAFIVGFILSTILTVLIYESREGQSISQVVNIKVKGK